MAAQIRTDIPRPARCSRGHAGRVWLAGWSRHPGTRTRRALHPRAGDGYYRRAIYECRPADPAVKPHRFTWVESRRSPTTGHPTGEICPNCEHEYGRGEGLRTGCEFWFSFREAADILVAIGQGSTYREAGARARLAAKRYRRAERDVSRDAHHVVSYLDVFAPVVLEKHLPRRTPRIMVLDTKTIMRGRPNSKKGSRKGARSMGEVIVVMDGEPERARVAATAILGGKDDVSIAEYLRSLPGPPAAWIVTDLDDSLHNAIAEVFPEATHYICHEHLRMLAEDALAADGLPTHEPRATDATGKALPRPPVAEVEDRVFERAKYGPGGGSCLTDLYTALRLCLAKRERWADFAARVAALPGPPGALAKWVADYGDLVLRQFDLVEAWGGHRPPVSNGGAESFLRAVDDGLSDARRGRFRNAGRFDKMLGLMAVEYNYEADPDEYAADLRRHFAANGGTSKAEWKKHLIGKGGESLAKRRQPVLDRQAAEDQSENTRLKKRREEAEEERRAAAGEPPLRSRKTRADGSSWKTSNSRRRLTLADFPAIRDQWHPTKNPAGEDPDKVRAALKETRWWQCPVDATHVWDATVESRTRRDSTCPFCTNRMACRTNSLARLFPEIAVLWHPTENGGLTPNEVLPALLRRSRGCARAATRSARP